MKKMTDLTQEQVGRITDLYRTRGATADTVERVARTWQITESDARTLGTAATTAPKAAPPRAVTELAEVNGSAAALSDMDARNRFLAGKLAIQVNEADARIEADGGSMAGLSTQQLEALAAARFGG